MHKPPFNRTPYNYDRDEASNQHGLECKDPSLAQQHFKDQCDINVLFARYLETGEMPQVQQTLNYQAFEGPFDFQTAMNAVRAAQEQFDELPARIKNRFDNDPQKLLDFLDKEENHDEAIFLKLIDAPVQKQPETPPAPTPPTATAGKGEKPADKQP